MAFVVFAFSLVLALAALWSGWMSLDLVPTPTGVLYALAGAVAAAMAVLAFAVGVAIRSIDALAALMRGAGAPVEGQAAARAAAPLAPLPEEEALARAPSGEAASEPADGHETSAPEASPTPAEAEAERALEEGSEHPINENRAGHLPTLGGVEPEPEPAGQPALVGRYSSGGADYKIFSDGAIEAETAEGTFKFASMGDFKRFIAERRESPARTSSPSPAPQSGASG